MDESQIHLEDSFCKHISIGNFGTIEHGAPTDKGIG